MHRANKACIMHTMGNQYNTWNGHQSKIKLHLCAEAAPTLQLKEVFQNGRGGGSPLWVLTGAGQDQAAQELRLPKGN